MTDKEETNFVQSPDEITTQKQTELAFNKSGQNLESAKEKVYGKVVAKNSREHYYIRVHQSVPFDPMGTYAKREQYVESKLQQVSKATFDFYMMYLKTKNTIYMTRARRGLTND
tara:strand:- start:619 stop:960 length:342 start_codon:yes stop_codon:yes gene_type:complete